MYGSSNEKVDRTLNLQGVYLRQLFAHSPEGIAIVDLQDSVIDVNKAFCEIFNYRLDEIAGKNLNNLIVPHRHSQINLSDDSRPKNYPKTYRLRKNGIKVPVSVLGIPIISEQKLIGSYWLYRDISDQVQAEKKRRKIDIRFRLLAENIQDLICLHHPDGSYDYISPSARKLLGYEMEELMEINPFNLIHPNEKREVEQAYIRAVESRETSEAIYRIKHKGGMYKWFDTNIQPIAKEGRVRCIVTSSRDITQAVVADEELKKSLDQKNILLSEIHHRVKNNLAIAASLIKLQAGQSGSEENQAMFNDTYYRIYAMSAIHEQLYQSNSFEKVDLKKYITKLTGFIFNSIGVRGITYFIEAEELYLKLQSAIPFGLIINELFTNSLKHAFKGRDHGTISIYLKKTNENEATLTFKDDGVGFPKVIDPQLTETLGMSLMNGLVNQIKGRLEVFTNQGTTFKVSFSIK